MSTTVASVYDVAALILQRLGPMTAMKLQKLVYYAQAWSLVWDEQPLFREPIEAWANGPVIPLLYAKHRGQFQVEAVEGGDASALNAKQRESVNAVLQAYGARASQWLSDLTHSEPPWRDARQGLQPGDRGNHEITHAAMAEFYGSLSAENAEALG